MIGGAFTLKQLEALIWVADLGSFRKAARHLNTTQPNISARIGGLEASMGVTLLQRGAGTVRTTPKGEALLTQARRVVAEAETLKDIADQPALIKDRLRLGVTEMVACTWLRDFMRRVNETYPNVVLELTVDLSRNLDKELTANTLDLAIQTAPFASKASGVIELGQFPFRWVAAPDIAARLPGKPALSDLIAHPILTHARDTQAHQEIVEYVAEQTPQRARIASSSSLMSCLHMAVDGMGVAALPLAMVGDHIADGSLIALDYEWTPTPLRFAARFQKDRRVSHVARAAELAVTCAAEFTGDQAINDH
ncbi:MAG: LysR family transcriptional regulator [Pikeienuella sp.]